MFTDAGKRKYRNDASVFVGERGVFSVSANYAWEGFELLIRMLIRMGVRFLKNPSSKALPIYANYGIHRLPSILRERQSWVPERKMTIACAYHN